MINSSGTGEDRSDVIFYVFWFAYVDLEWIISFYIAEIYFRVVVQGPGPGPRYGHAMDLVAQRYLVTVSGNDGELCL